MKLENKFKFLENKNILVTGGAGFIGSNLCGFLINCGANVRCFDNFSTGFKSNIFSLKNKKNFSLIEGDIRSLNQCIIATKNIDYVLHQAALGSVPRSINDPKTTNDVNIGGFLNILLASRDNKVKRVVYAASSSTYGDSKNLPKTENKIGNPMSPYAITKYVNELYATNFKKNFNLDTIGLRYFNVFGPKQDPNGSYAAVIPLFIKKIINNERPKINGDGEYSRDFTYVDNVIYANILSILSNNKDSINQIYNVACGERNSLNQLFKSIKANILSLDLDRSNLKPIYGPVRSGDVPHSLASIKKAKKLLKYNPIVNFDDGILKTIKWYIDNTK